MIDSGFWIGFYEFEQSLKDKGDLIKEITILGARSDQEKMRETKDSPFSLMLFLKF